MAKRDLATDTLLHWDEYEDKSPEEALPAIYAHAAATSKTVCGWYWAGIRRKRRAALAARFITFALLIFGTVLPIVAGLRNSAEVRLQFTQSGVAAAAAGGLLQVADRVFGWSSGWIRYVTTVTTMENLTRAFELDWAGYILGKGGVLDRADMKPLFDIAERFETEIRKLQADETEKWAVEFNSGTALLNDLIKAQRETGERAVQAARSAVAAQHAAQAIAERSSHTGAVELTLGNANAAIPVSIAIDAEAGVAFNGTVWSRLGLPAGQHTVTVHRDTPPLTIIRVVDVPASGIARIGVDIA